MVSNATKRFLTNLAFFGSMIIVLFIAMPSLSDWHSLGFSTFWIVWVLVMSTVAFRFRDVFSE